MARVTYVLIPEGLTDLYGKVIKPNDRFAYSSVRRQPLFTSRKRKKGLTLKSLTPAASIIWDTLTTPEKDAWKSAGLVSNYTSFQCFLRDYASRIRNSLTVPGTPSDYVQNSCLRCIIASPATHMKLVQEHPFTYYILRKVTGTRNMYNPVLVTEQFGMPVDISINYKSTLTAAGADPSAKFYLEILSNYQGRDLVTTLTANLSISSGWATATASLFDTIGVVRGYNAYIEMTDVQGTIDFDNPEINHSGQNWCRDPRCDNAATTYTKAFYQIARNWAAIDLPTGTYYDSLYYEL